MIHRMAAVGVLAMCATVWAEAPTGWSVELAEAGRNKIQVIKALREVTGLGLKEAKDLIEAAPRTVVSHRTQADAEQVARKLRDAGATARIVSPAGARSVAPDEANRGHSVTLTAIGPNKILVIKHVREATGLGLKETKDLVEAAPTRVKSDLTPEQAAALVLRLTDAGASASASGPR